MVISVVSSAAVAVGACAAPVGDPIVLGALPDAGSAPTPFVQLSEEGGSPSDQSVPTVAMCTGTECPYPFATCPNADGTLAFKCGANLLADDTNCGACGNVCPSDFGSLQMTTRCLDGVCQPMCKPYYQDCNGRVDDGCESPSSTDPDNCASCGNRCPDVVDDVRFCYEGQCECPAGNSYCNGYCINTITDPQNCGACGNQCPPVNQPAPPFMTYGCSGGECGKLVCLAAMIDCNNDLSDGCEVNLFDTNNCGRCGNVCARGQVCIIRPERGDGPVCACEPNETLCTTSGNVLYCADLLSNVENCGGCGEVCPPHGLVTCRNGYCKDECPPSWGECDDDIRNGCETNLLIDPRNCGACGNQCDTAAGQPCVNGKCLTVECDAGEVTR